MSLPYGWLTTSQKFFMNRLRMFFCLKKAKENPGRILAGGVSVALRTIRMFDDEFLHKVSRPVDDVDDRIREILNDMAETMYNTQNGGGLAACQIGILRRLVVADMGEGLLKLVNPQIVECKGDQLVIEGCLSYPGIWGKVLRPREIVVQALNENGDPIVVRGVGEMAKCLCHEIDHTNGIIYKDKITEYVEMD